MELADGTLVNSEAKLRGTVLTQFRTKNGDFVDVKLRNVLYVPNLVKSATTHGS